MLTSHQGKRSEIEAHSRFFDGCAYQAIGNLRRAMAYYRAEIRKTSYWKAHYNLAYLLTRRGRLRDAIFHYRKAAMRSASAASKSDALNNLGLLYSRKRLRAEAIAAFIQARRKNPRNPAVHVNGALEFFRGGDRRKGLQWLERARRLGRISPETQSWVGYALIEHDLDVRRGVRILERILRDDPHNTRVIADLARGYMKLGDRTKAVDLGKRLRRMDPQDHEAQEQVRRALRLVGKVTDSGASRLRRSAAARHSKA